MHELSIVLSIVDIAQEELKKNEAHQVESIELEIGTMAGVEFSALEFAWEAGVKNTILEKSKKIVNKIQAKARCTNCNSIFTVEGPFAHCLNCDNIFVEYLTGKELRVKSLVIS